MADDEDAKNAIQSINPSSTVARLTLMGLRVIPPMSHLNRLRSLDLSGNLITDIEPGWLPTSVRVLNLSRNRIRTIDGLREVDQLRVLDLSHNRIKHIGSGLYNCNHVKEVYLSRNEISDSRGLTRLVKLGVLDIGFNKIVASEALRPLTANDKTLRVLNLVGNPIQSKMKEEQLRRTVCSLLPNLRLLDNHSVSNANKAQEIRDRTIIIAALF